MLLSPKHQQILDYIVENPLCSSKEISDELANDLAYATIKRNLQILITENLVTVTGIGKATRYSISKSYELLHTINVDTYFLKEIDERSIKSNFNFELIKGTLSNVSVFTKDELLYLKKLQAKYLKNCATLTKSEYKKELNRLAIDLSWKSSQIEGNTYTLLETELLLNEKQTAKGKTKDEATMLLNHKIAIDFVINTPEYVKPLSVARIEDIHSLLVKDLDINKNIRKNRVGISGTNYKPLDNEFQIKEALEHMCMLINKQKNAFEKALLALILLSYIQAFSDGNKRTARIISNALLINQGFCPLSYRTADPIEYKKAMLIFYEQNNISAFKKIFINQFEFAINTYF